MPNPLDYVTPSDIDKLGLSTEELSTSYQPSAGGVYHARGAEGLGKTALIAHMYRSLIDRHLFTPHDAYGNLTFKGKYGDGFTTLKGERLFELLWDLTHKPYMGKIVIISEIDSEFPARFFASKDQTEIALRMWHIHKLHNFVFMDSHIGNSTDVIFHLASHYLLLPHGINWQTQTLPFTVISNLGHWVDNFKALDIVKTMLIYNRRELTEDMAIESSKNPYRQQSQKKVQKNQKSQQELPDGIDEIIEIDAARHKKVRNFA